MKPLVHSCDWSRNSTYCGITHEELYCTPKGAKPRLDTWSTLIIEDVTCEDCKDEYAMKTLAHIGEPKDYFLPEDMSPVKGKMRI